MGWIESNPFYVLDVSMKDSRQTILQLAEERGLFGDADVCEAAATQLTNINKRISAEVRWFAGTPDDTIRNLVKSLKSNGNSDLPEIPLNPLSDYIYILAVTEKQKPVSSDQLATLKKFIVKLDRSYQALRADNILKDINDSRSAAGIPLIDSAGAISKEIAALRADARSILSGVLSSLSEHDLISLMTAISTSDIDRQGSDFGVILEDVMELYQIKMEPALNQTAESIYKRLDELKERLEEFDAVTEDASYDIEEKNRCLQLVSAKIDEIIKLAEEFDRYAQPLQSLSCAKGTEHELSEEVAFQVREVAIAMFNKYDDTDITKESARMTGAFQEIFAKLPATAEQLSIDTAYINRFNAQVTAILVILALLIIAGLIIGLRFVLGIVGIL